MNKHPLNIVIRAQDLKRWHTVNTIRPQTLADHHWAVLVIALDILDQTGIGGDYPTKLELVERCIYHDVDEVYKGDTPAPRKDSDNAGAGFCPPFKDEIWAILKVADAMEAYNWIRHNCAGEYTENIVVENCRQRYHRRVKQAADQFFGSSFFVAAGSVLISLNP